MTRTLTTAQRRKIGRQVLCKRQKTMVLLAPHDGEAHPKRYEWSLRLQCWKWRLLGRI